MKFTEFLKKVDDTFLEISDSDLNCFYTNRTVAMVYNKLEKEWKYDG